MSELLLVGAAAVVVVVAQRAPDMTQMAPARFGDACDARLNLPHSANYERQL